MSTEAEGKRSRKKQNVLGENSWLPIECIQMSNRFNGHDLAGDDVTGRSRRWAQGDGRGRGNANRHFRGEPAGNHHGERRREGGLAGDDVTSRSRRWAQGDGRGRGNANRHFQGKPAGNHHGERRRTGGYDRGDDHRSWSRNREYHPYYRQDEGRFRAARQERQGTGQRLEQRQSSVRADFVMEERRRIREARQEGVWEERRRWDEAIMAQEEENRRRQEEAAREVARARGSSA